MFANAAPRIFTLARAAWASLVPALVSIIFGEMALNVPAFLKVSRFLITVQVPVTTPPGEELHVNTPCVPVQIWLKKPATVLVSDRKSTRLNSSHGYISYAVFCLKKKKKDKY